MSYTDVNVILYSMKDDIHQYHFILNLSMKIDIRRCGISASDTTLCPSDNL